jgi:hypothetical protein
MVDLGLGPVQKPHFLVVVGYDSKGVIVNSGSSSTQNGPMESFPKPMESLRIMDSAHSSRNIFMNITAKNIAFYFFSMWAFFFLSGCSIPQIIILKDPLTPEEYLRLGVSYESNNQLELAEAQYQKAAAHDVPEAFLF